MNIDDYHCSDYSFGVVRYRTFIFLDEKFFVKKCYVKNIISREPFIICLIYRRLGPGWKIVFW